MIRNVFTGLLVLVISLVVIGLFLPRQVVVEVDRVIDHPREGLFEVLQDFHHFPRWAAWFDRDPDVTLRIEGPPAGIGSTLVWEDARGGGRLWIVGLSGLERVEMQLERGDNEAEMVFLIEPAASPGYRVRWVLQLEIGVFDLVGRYAGLLLPRLVGREYAKGLERLGDYLDQSRGGVPEPPPLVGD